MGDRVIDINNPPLINTVINGDMNDIKKILDDGANINQQNKQGFTALMFAITHKFINVVRYLIERGADVNIPSTKNSPIIISCYYDYVDVTKLLIDSEANLNLTDAEGNNAILLASERGSLNLMKVLIDGGANVNSTNVFGNTPLIVTSRNDKIELTKLLLDSGADANIKNKKGFNPIITAVNNANDRTIDILIKTGCDISIKNGDKNLIECYKSYWSKYKTQKLIFENQPYNIKLIDEQFGVRDDVKNEFPTEYYMATTINAYSV